MWVKITNWFGDVYPDGKTRVSLADGDVRFLPAGVARALIDRGAAVETSKPSDEPAANDAEPARRRKPTRARKTTAADTPANEPASAEAEQTETATEPTAG